MFRLNIDYGSAMPIYEQVCQGIKLEILAGRLKDGDLMPPIRELAKILKLNPNTVAKAYDNLEKEGLVTSKRGSGNWISSRKANLDSLRRGMLEDEFRSFITRAFSLGAKRQDIINLMTEYVNHEPRSD